MVKDGILKLIDYGTCVAEGRIVFPDIATTEYQPPELRYPTKDYTIASHSSDIWSYGVCVIEVFLRIVPFKVLDYKFATHKILPLLERSISRIVYRALSLEPRHRRLD